MIAINKAKLANDVFSTREEAIARSMDLKMEGETHVYDIDGQAFYMPGKSHDEYLAYYGFVRETDEDRYSALVSAITAIVSTVMNKKDADMDDKNIVSDFMKFDEEQRLVYGWASVVTEKGEPVVDRQGDIIAPETLVKAVNAFMEDVRVAKEMHEGNAIGRVIHSLPVTNEIAKSLGIQSDREGWIVAMKIYDDDVWKRVRSGELAAFSIGGRATREEANG